MSIEVAVKKKLHNFNLDVSFTAENEYLGLLGASGCGKSMTLKCIAGIEKPDSGYIRINGRTVFDSEKHINLKPGERKCGFLFQNYALFPTMTIAQNIELVLHRLPAAVRKEKTSAVLSRFGIAELAGRKCTELSGGQQQRAALARIMVNNPGIIMLDEPFSALDSFVKQQVETNLINMMEGFNRTVLFVSHDRDEIYRICDNIAVISDGIICRKGTCRDVFVNPETVAAARLTGCKNIAGYRKTGKQCIFISDWNIELCTAADVPYEKGYAGIRAHYMHKPDDTCLVNCYDFTVKQQLKSPFNISVYLSNSGAAVPIDWEVSINTSTITSDLSLNAVEKICIPPESIMFLTE
ncbi:MAG: ATP-binding cassette domain-containing protein [Treponema sp.]|nr:ATP-binding cassette domain-containing protein [Treponema sp.]